MQKLLFTLLLLTNSLLMSAQITYVAHRGASHLAPENTLASIQLAWELDADAAECDIMLTKDKKVIVFHDKKGLRLLNKNITIAKSNYKQIKDLPINLKPCNQKKFKGQTIPLLKDVLATLPADKQLIIEIKTAKEILPHLQKVIKKHWKSGKIVFIAFDFETILATKELYPQIPCYYLSSTREDLHIKFKKIINSKLDGIDLNHKIIDASLVAKYKKHNKATWCWTVNSPKAAARMKKCGVTCITTDRPKWLKEKMQALQKK